MTAAASLIARLAARQHRATCAIQRNTPTQDNTGSPVDAWATVHPAVTCHIQFTAGSEGVRYGRENERLFGKAYVPAGYDIRSGDRIVWNSRTFDIQVPRTPGEFRSTDRLGFMVLDIEETSE